METLARIMETLISISIFDMLGRIIIGLTLIGILLISGFLGMLTRRRK